jgi:hypothetical protein
LELPTKVVLRVGERARLPLTGAGSAGYFWQTGIFGDVSAVTATTGPEQPPPAVTRREPYGCSAAQALFIEAIEPGRVTIRLALIRGSTPPPPPRETHEIVVIVE